MLIPRQVAILSKIAARDASRYAINTIRLERRDGRPRALATDGRRLVIVNWDEPELGSFPLIEGVHREPASSFGVNIQPRALVDVARGVAKTSRPPLDHILLDESDAALVKMAAMTPGNITRSEVQAEESTFPPCDDVVPNPGPVGMIYDPRRHGELPCTHIRIAVNGRMLAETVKVLAELASDSPDQAVVLTVPVTGISPIRLDAVGIDRRAVAALALVAVDARTYEDLDDPQQTDAAAAA